MTTEEIMLRVFLTYLAIFGVFNLAGYIYLKRFVAEKPKPGEPELNTKIRT